MKIVRTPLILLLLAIATLGQEPRIEYGSPDELKWVTKIFIYTGTNVESRNLILKEIKKKLPSLIITDRSEDAEIVLSFEAANFTRPTGTHSNRTETGSGSQTNTAINHEKVKEGRGIVSKQTGPDRLRVLMEFNDSKSTMMEKDPATNFAKAFIKEYQKANKEKK